VIPKGARELFGIRPGDSLLLMADKKRGIALVAADELSAPAGLFELAKEAEDEDEQNSDG
jgi:AbrB family looped-hinge helix DNA binding protein